MLDFIEEFRQIGTVAGGSFNGRTTGSGPVNGGSNPPPPAIWTPTSYPSTLLRAVLRQAQDRESNRTVSLSNGKSNHFGFRPALVRHNLEQYDVLVLLQKQRPCNLYLSNQVWARDFVLRICTFNGERLHALLWVAPLKPGPQGPDSLLSRSVFSYLGSMIVKVVPAPQVLDTRMSPPCSLINP